MHHLQKVQQHLPREIRAKGIRSRLIAINSIAVSDLTLDFTHFDYFMRILNRKLFENYKNAIN